MSSQTNNVAGNLAQAIGNIVSVNSTTIAQQPANQVVPAAATSNLLANKVIGNNSNMIQMFANKVAPNMLVGYRQAKPKCTNYCAGCSCGPKAVQEWHWNNKMRAGYCAICSSCCKKEN